MTPEEIVDLIEILVIPEPDNEFVEGSRDLAPTARFWLHTTDMSQFGRPEFEMRNVPLLGIPQAFRMLNSWAAHTVEDEIKPDQRLLFEVMPGLRMLLVSSESPDEEGFWADGEASCIRLDIERVSSPTCHHCGEGCCHEDEGPEDGKVLH